MKGPKSYTVTVTLQELTSYSCEVTVVADSKYEAASIASDDVLNGQYDGSCVWEPAGTINRVVTSAIVKKEGYKNDKNPSVSL